MARILKITNLRVVSRFLTYLHFAIKYTDLFHNMDVFRKSTAYPSSQHHIDKYYAIDVLVCKVMDEVKEKCRKLHTGSIPCSPVYKKSYLLLEYWLPRCSHFYYKHRYERQLIVLQNRLQLTYEPSLNITKIGERTFLAHSNRKKYKRSVESLRLEYRTQLAMTKEEESKINVASFLAMSIILKHKGDY